MVSGVCARHESVMPRPSQTGRPRWVRAGGGKDQPEGTGWQRVKVTQRKGDFLGML